MLAATDVRVLPEIVDFTLITNATGFGALFATMLGAAMRFDRDRLARLTLLGSVLGAAGGTLLHADAIGSVALAQAVRWLVEDLGVRTAAGAGQAMDGVEIELRAQRFFIDTGDGDDLAGVAVRLAQFVARVLKAT